MSVSLSKIYDTLNTRDWQGLNIKNAITLWNCKAFDILANVYKKPRYLTERVAADVTKDFLCIFKYTNKQTESSDETAKEVLDFLYTNSQSIANAYNMTDLIYLLGTNSEQPDYNYSMVNRLTILLAMALKNDVKIDK